MDILKTALSQYGVIEVPGEEDNPEILKYFKEIGHTWVKSEATAWCSAFVNWVALISGHEYSGKLNARSWLDVGEEVENPEPGDIVVMWRESKNSWKGHVGIYCNHTDSVVWTLGGNQSNMVRVSAYPLERVLSYRRLNKTQDT
jgi:uncharacterized protein (TIGR02594 family)